MELFPVRRQNGKWLVYVGQDGIVEVDSQTDAELIAQAKHECRLGNDADLCVRIADILDRYRANTNCARELRARAAQIRASKGPQQGSGTA